MRGVHSWRSCLLIILDVRRPVELVAVFLAVLAAGAALRTLRGSLVAAIRRGLVDQRLAGAEYGRNGRAPRRRDSGPRHRDLDDVRAPLRGDPGEESEHRRGRTTRNVSGISQCLTTRSRRPRSWRSNVDGHRLWPAVTTYNGRGGTTVGTPAIDSNLARDIYVTFDAVGGNGTTSGAQVQNDLPAGSVVLGVTVEPLLAWLWLGGLIIGAGSALTFVRRRHGDEGGS